MRTIVSHQHRQAVRNLSFCYLCGAEFTTQDEADRDHVPPECVFAKEDREPLILRTHRSCNSAHKLTDEKIGQLIALRRGAAPAAENRRLVAKQLDAGVAIWNLDVDAAVWRWISGFHAALYREPLRIRETGDTDKPFVRSLVVPFPKAPKRTGQIEPLLTQHQKYVATVKSNRFRRNLDLIHCNKGKLRYECVWDRADNADLWMCIFALDVCDWKDLGRASGQPARGCAGFYVLDTGMIPDGGVRSVASSIILPNYDQLDPFAP